MYVFRPSSPPGQPEEDSAADNANGNANSNAAAAAPLLNGGGGDGGGGGGGTGADVDEVDLEFNDDLVRKKISFYVPFHF